MDVTVAFPAVSWVDSVGIYRRLGPCPVTRNDAGTEFVGGVVQGPATQHVLETTPLAAGHWCYAAFSVDEFDGPRPPAATREIDYLPPA